MAVGEKVYIADKATQDEINQNVDGIVSNIGTTTDSGATSTTGTLMGKVNAVLNNTGSLVEFYYPSKTVKQSVISKKYTISSTSSSRFMYLGKWVAERTGYVVINFTGQATGTQKYCYFYAQNAKWLGAQDSGSSTYLSTMGQPAIEYDVLELPIGTLSTNLHPKSGSTMVYQAFGAKSTNYSYMIHVSKGDMLIFSIYSRPENPDDTSGGNISKLDICYSDTLQE